MITLVQSYFRDYPAEAKLWIFMAEKKLDTGEGKVISAYMNDFLPEWNAHGDALKAGFEVIYNQFLVVVVDESPASASGCSIDALTRYIQMIEGKIGVSFTNRMLVNYMIDSENHIAKLSDFKTKVRNGELPENTIVFNNSVSNLSDFWDEWQQPLVESWAASLLPT